MIVLQHESVLHMSCVARRRAPPSPPPRTLLPSVNDRVHQSEHPKRRRGARQGSDDQQGDRDDGGHGRRDAGPIGQPSSAAVRGTSPAALGNECGRPAPKRHDGDKATSSQAREHRSQWLKVCLYRPDTNDAGQ